MPEPNPQTPPTPPAFEVPAKFKNPDGTPNWENFVKSYTAMEPEYTRLKQGVQQPGGTPPAEGTPDTPPTRPSLEIDTPKPGLESLSQEIILKRSGLKVEDIEKQWTETGDLTPEQYSALGRAGMSKQFAREYVEGIAAKAELEASRVTGYQREGEEIAGGKQQHEMLREWAKANVDAQKLAGWNAQVKANPSFYPDMVRLIAMEYTNKVGEKPNLVSAESAATSGAQPAKDSKELAKLVKELSNSTDPGVQASLMARIRATKASKWTI
jgi:hypothetical protein